MRRWLLLSALALPMAALAHHSFAMFDMSKDLTVNGTVKQFLWESPHSWLEIIVADDTGTQTEWSLEMGAPNALYQRGWRQQSIAPGEKITAVLHPLRDGRRGGSLVSVTLANGTQLFGSGGSAAPATPSGSAP